MSTEIPEEIANEDTLPNFCVSEEEQISLREIDAMQDKVLDELEQLNDDICALIEQLTSQETDEPGTDRRAA